MDFSIRRLSAEDWAEYRELRLDGLQRAPEAFGGSVAQESEVSESDWRQTLSGERAFFGAFGGDQLLGAVNFLQETGAKLRHKSWLLGMYVRPEGRGTGCALALVQRLIAHARTTDALQIQLGVGAYNMPAQRLYQRAGFEIYGTEPRGLICDGRPIDEHLMVKFLDKEDTV